MSTALELRWTHWEPIFNPVQFLLTMEGEWLKKEDLLASLNGGMECKVDLFLVSAEGSRSICVNWIMGNKLR
jgi:hypothetical protein